jgi:hypothetical protein
MPFYLVIGFAKPPMESLLAARVTQNYTELPNV